MLLELEADADTLLAALATHFLGLNGNDDDSDATSWSATERAEKLAVVRSQCGPIVYQIVRDGARLGGVFRPPPEATRFRRDAHEYQALWDLDHHNAGLARYVDGWVGRRGEGRGACRATG